MIQSLVGGLRNLSARAQRAEAVETDSAGAERRTAMPKGFRDRFEKILRESDFPIELSEIRLAAEPLTTTAKGALVAALCDM